LISPRRQQINRFLAAHADRLTGTVLDIGVGRRGWVPPPGARVTTMDCHDGPGVDLVGHIDVAIPGPPGSHATVKATEVLDLVQTLPIALSEIRRALPDGGTLIATVPFMRPVTEPRDRQRLTPLAWRALLAAAGLQLELVWPLGGLPTLLAEIAYQRCRTRLGRWIWSHPLAAVARWLDGDGTPAWTCGYGLVAAAV
jgi:hypothetical protein